MNLSIASMEYADSSTVAEAKLFGGGIDFIAGNHISPYMWVARNRPIVQIASPGNFVRDSIMSSRPLGSMERGLEPHQEAAPWSCRTQPTGVGQSRSRRPQPSM